ncbi:glycosyltransferase family 2 protein [bacterium]|nr:glycosyltransferase family 2 protein [candidate division CSSED10-310 bacterium]
MTANFNTTVATGPDLAAPFISIVIPAKGGIGTLRRCLDSIAAAVYERQEVIIVDDGIDADLHAELLAGGHRLVPNQGKGVSAARNTGACEATGDVIFFVDSDILISPDTLSRLAAHFSQPEVDGVVGVLSTEIPHEDFFSHYKNLWMRYTYLRVPDTIALFYTSVAAIRRSHFLDLGGFDEHYCSPSVEDTDFGHKLGRHRITIRSDKELEVVHLKRYRFADTLRTDFQRSSALVRHVLRTSPGIGPGRLRQTSVPIHFTSSVILSLVLSPLLAVAGICRPGLLPAAAGLLGGGVCLANLPFLRFLRMCRGTGFMVKSCLFLPLDILSVDLGILHGFWSYLRGKRY